MEKKEREKTINDTSLKKEKKTKNKKLSKTACHKVTWGKSDLGSKKKREPVGELNLRNNTYRNQMHNKSIFRKRGGGGEKGQGAGPSQGCVW